MDVIIYKMRPPGKRTQSAIWEAFVFLWMAAFIPTVIVMEAVFDGALVVIPLLIWSVPLLYGAAVRYQDFEAAIQPNQPERSEYPDDQNGFNEYRKASNQYSDAIFQHRWSVSNKLLPGLFTIWVFFNMANVVVFVTGRSLGDRPGSFSRMSSGA